MFSKFGYGILIEASQLHVIRFTSAVISFLVGATLEITVLIGCCFESGFIIG